MKPSSNLAIKTSKLTRKFGDLVAVNNLDLEVETGTIYGFLGPNGCGKSTPIRMLCGLLTPSSGSVEVLGYQIPEQAETLKKNVGYMTQTFSLYRDLTVTENLAFMGEIYGLEPKSVSHRIDELLSRYSLYDSRNQIVGSMSGGQRQRLSLATAVIHNPDLLFLDEPTSAVDPENRRDFWEKLFDLSEQGTTIIVSTHYMDEAERCHKLAILERGIMRADDSPNQLMNEMGANVIEVKGKNLRDLKQKLLGIIGIRSVAQQGMLLRVLVDKNHSDPIQYLQQQLPMSHYELRQTRPSLEDVFVMVTGDNR